MIKRRSLWLQALWMVLTVGIYSIYWFYATTKEMSQYLGREDEVGLWTVLSIIPIVQIYPMYKESELFEIVSKKSVDRWVIFLFWVVFPPVVWFIVQRKLNSLAPNNPQLPTAGTSALESG